jgi:Tetratricopeptide repeat
MLIRLSSTLTFLALAAALLTAPANAQPSVPRPKLDAKADTNSWESYFDEGVARLKFRPAQAEAYFDWASRLDPSRAEPLFARWVAFHMTDIHRFEDYLAERPKVVTNAAVLAHDSLRYAASARNPFFHRGLELMLYDQLPGQFDDDQYTLGFIAYAKPNLPKATEYLARVGRADKRYASARFLRAQAFVGMRQYDSAAAEIGLLRARLDAREAGTLVRFYESRELFDYALGLLYAANHQPARARETLQRAVLENAGFHPAHRWLGDLALDDGDVTGALAEYEQALAVDSTDAVLQLRYGVALGRAGRLPPAVAVLLQATLLAPSWAVPWFELGRTLDRGGDPTAAVEAYRTFLAMAPRSDSAWTTIVRDRLAALGAPR